MNDNRERIERMALEDPLLQAVFHNVQAGCLTYEQALEVALIAIVQYRDHLRSAIRKRFEELYDVPPGR